MRNILSLGAVITTALLMTACASTPNAKRLHVDARPLIKNIDTVLIATQDEIDADIKTSKLSLYAQGHFIPVLLDIGINMYRTHEANEIMKPIHETMVASDYKHDVKEALDFALADSGLEGVGEVELLRNSEPLGFRAQYVRESEADAVMFVDVQCRFTPKFDALKVVSRVMVFPVDPKLSPYKEIPDDDGILEFEDNIYRNHFAAVIPVSDDEDGSKKENGAVWGNMSEDQISYRLRIAAQKLADVIAEDLRIDDNPNGINNDIDVPAATEVIPEVDLPDWATGETTETDAAPEATPEPVSNVVPDALPEPVADAVSTPNTVTDS